MVDAVPHTSHAPVRLVVTDMDGTLLDGDGLVPDAFWPLLDRMQESGIVFVPASGRQYATLARIFDRNRTGMVFISDNGTYVVRDDEELASETIPLVLVRPLVEHLRDRARAGYDIGVVVSGKRSAYVERTDPAFLVQAETYCARLAVVDDVLAVDDEILKVAIVDFAGAETGTSPTLDPFRGELQIVVSGQHWIDVMSLRANKGRAVERLQAELGISREETVAFGDYLNDLEMLDAAGQSYAMADAHPLVLDRARHVAPSHREHGVVTVLTALTWDGTCPTQVSP